MISSITGARTTTMTTSSTSTGSEVVCRRMFCDCCPALPWVTPLATIATTSRAAKAMPMPQAA